MSEIIGENLPRSKGGVSGLLIRAKVKFLDPPPIPGHFDKRESPDPYIPGEVIKEEDLPIINEAVDLLGQARKKGLLVSKPENPFGKSLSSIKLELMGDMHIYGSYPEELVETRSPIIGKLQDLGPKSLKARLAAYKAPPGIDPVFKDQEGYVGTGTNWANEILPTFSVQGFRAAGEAIVQDISRSQEFLKPDSAVAIIDIGDKHNTGVVMGDIALIAIEYENLRRKAEGIANEASTAKEGIKIYMGLVEGNYESDLNNKGLPNEKIKRLLYGNQIFFQEVSGDYAILALNSNFASSIWWSYFDRERKSPHTKEEKIIIKQIEEEIELQKKLVEKAIASNRKLVVIGHQIEYVNEIIPIKKTRITHVVCGHLHLQKVGTMKEKNVAGDNVEIIRVGATMAGLAGWEKVQNPAPFSLSIKRSENGETVIEVKRLEIPDHVKDVLLE